GISLGLSRRLKAFTFRVACISSRLSESSQPQSRKQLGTSSGRVPQPGRLLRISSARSTSHGDCRETQPAAARGLFSPFAGGCFLFVPIWIWALPPFILMFCVSVI